MIDHQEKIRLLKKLLEKSKMVVVECCSDSNFQSWKHLVERTLVKVFGAQSTEFKHFSELKFFYDPIMWSIGSDFTNEDLQEFKRSFKILISSIEQYIEELEEQPHLPSIDVEVSSDCKTSKVFISHASKDASLVEEVIELLETMGLESHQIFCSSFDGYGINLGENFLETLKQELSSDTLVLFILTKNFYQSPVCLCEMGATWVLAKEHIPIVVPPLDYSDIQGVIPLTQGIKIDDPLKLNLLKEKIEKDFFLVQASSFSTWERKRDRVLSRVSSIIQSSRSGL
ncbi:TPA: toll/interleukin-1 receptor domain-containing protein [Vibrio vulnificus]|uniref:toll/interleukin-1 receptor domain-containing protein n=1 Tax=Vibrio campbellii TaxID=680 RepID=UPI0028CA6DB2|nr:toll/interleukin-1 receptor domain-containing protein [Vibrio vulnificus]